MKKKWNSGVMSAANPKGVRKPKSKFKVITRYGKGGKGVNIRYFNDWLGASKELRRAVMETKTMYELKEGKFKKVQSLKSW